jgi:hypothetical protein
VLSLYIFCYKPVGPVLTFDPNTVSKGLVFSVPRLCLFTVEQFVTENSWYIGILHIERVIHPLRLMLSYTYKDLILTER